MSIRQRLSLWKKSMVILYNGLHFCFSDLDLDWLFSVWACGLSQIELIPYYLVKSYEFFNESPPPIPKGHTRTIYLRNIKRVSRICNREDSRALHIACSFHLLREIFVSFEHLMIIAKNSRVSIRIGRRTIYIASAFCFCFDTVDLVLPWAITTPKNKPPSGHILKQWQGLG